MKRWIYLILVIILLVGALPSHGGQVEYIDVKIGNLGLAEEVTLYSDSGFSIYEKNTKEVLYEIAAGELRLLPNGDEMEILDYSLGADMDLSNVDSPNGSSLDAEAEEKIQLAMDGSIIIGAQDDSLVKVGENSYRDYISFLKNSSSILILNHIHIEHYLMGVLAKEMPASSPMDALKAQAIAARSYTYTSLSRHKGEGFNLCSTTHCQVYAGYEGEHPRTNEAVIHTFGEYIIYGGRVVNTPYHSNSGGYTEASENVWGGSLAYLRAVKDDYSLNSPHSSWTISFAAEELEAKLRAGGVDLGQLKDIEILNTTESGRVADLKVIGSRGEKVLKGSELRSLLGANNLKSTLFTISKEGSTKDEKVHVIAGDGQIRAVDLNGLYIIDGSKKLSANNNDILRIKSKDTTYTLENKVSKPTAFIFDGKGYGHGVGMSQYGAIEMAKLGYNYIDIIKHYYTGVEVKNIGK